MRLALLTGVYIEAEEGMPKDSVQLKDIMEKTFRSMELAATQKLRWEIRPTIDLQPSDNWSLSFRPFFKFPTPWNWNETVESKDGSEFDKQFDYMIDFLASLKITLTEADQILNKKIKIGLDYRYIFDNSPPRIYLDEIGMDDKPILLKARSANQIFRFNFTVDF